MAYLERFKCRLQKSVSLSEVVIFIYFFFTQERRERMRSNAQTSSDKKIRPLLVESIDHVIDKIQ